MRTGSLTRWVLRVFIIVLIADQVRNDIGLADVDQKTVSYHDGPLQFCECTVSLAQVFDLVLPVEWVALDVELPALVVVPTAHHWVHRGLVLTCVRIVWIVHRNDEIIHFLFENLFSCGVFDVAASGSSSIVGLIVFVSLGAVLDSKVSEPVKLLSSGPVFVSNKRLTIEIVVLLLWQNAERVQEKSEVLLEMSRAQHFELQGWHHTLLDQLLQLGLSYLHAVVVEIVLQFLGVKNVKPILLMVCHCSHVGCWSHCCLSTWRFHTTYSVRV
jgi:hypothetical protein